MQKHYNVWTIFHDGGIEKLGGSVPGNLEIKIEIPYIRHVFSKDGNSIWVFAKECSQFQYEPWDESSVIYELAEIEKLGPEILSISDEDDDELLIYCDNGMIRTKYKDAEYELDNGVGVTYDDLQRACDEYWNDSKRS